MRICENDYTRNSEIQYLLDEREEILKLELKVQEQELGSQPCSPALASTPTARAIIPRFSRDEEAAIEASVLASLGRPVPSTSSNTAIASSSRFTGAALPPIPESSSSQRASPPSSSAGPATLPTSSIPIDPALDLDSDEVNANLAMVSDGSRYSGHHAASDVNQLPPYSPGNQRTMSGHGDESNEIRLSEYVKGETRAQHMKDGYQ